MPELDAVGKALRALITTRPATHTHEDATRLAQEDDRGTHYGC
jgi:hypothetical protein